MSTVSVIIPSFNHATYLPAAVDSALNQTTPPHEIIIVDDGSTDGTGQVAASYGKRVQYVYQQNGGLSAARNTGIARATGEMIVLLDADDLLEPGFISIMTGALANAPDAAAVFCGYRMVDDANNSLFQTGPGSIDTRRIRELMLDGNYLAAHCLLLRRAALEQTGPFDQSLTACEDWDMWLRLTRHNQLLAVPDLLVRYRVQSGSMSDNPRRMLDNRLAVLQKVEAAEPELPPERLRRARARAWRAAAVEWLQVGDHSEAVHCLLQAARLDPSILLEQETAYELVMWDQPRGQRGDVHTLNMELNEARLFRLLDTLLDELPYAAADGAYRSKVRATAHRTVGAVYYARREMAAARHHVAGAARLEPGSLVSRQTAFLWLKSLLAGRVSPRREVG